MASRTIYKLFPYYYNSSCGKHWMKIRAIPKVTLIGLNERLVNDKMIINNSYILLTVCCIAAMESALFILINFYNNPIAAAAAANSLQSCPTLRSHRRQPTRLPRPWDSPGKNTGVGCHFLLQCMKVKVKSISRVRPSATPWTAAFQAPPSMGFSRQEYWSGVPLPSPIMSV